MKERACNYAHTQTHWRALGARRAPLFNRRRRRAGRVIFSRVSRKARESLLLAGRRRARTTRAGEQAGRRRSDWAFDSSAAPALGERRQISPLAAPTIGFVRREPAERARDFLQSPARERTDERTAPEQLGEIFSRALDSERRARARVSFCELPMQIFACLGEIPKLARHNWTRSNCKIFAGKPVGQPASQQVSRLAGCREL